MVLDVDSRQVDLKRIEQKAYRSSGQDGLGPTMAGILLIGMAVCLCFSSPLPLIFFFVGALFLFPRIATAIKKRVTYPRIGYAKLHADRSVKPKIAMLFRFFLAFIVFAGWVIPLMIFGDTGDLWRKWTLVLAGMVTVVSLIDMAVKSGQIRHYAFAFLIVAGGIALSIIDFGFGYATGAALFVLSIGGLFLTYGTSQFIRLLRKYPKVAQEASDGEN